MNELQEKIYIEKFRPLSFDDLILENKAEFLKLIENPKLVPSFIFYSSSPGTGKTSTAKLIIKHLGCDSLTINASMDRGIDVIREKVSLFARSLSSSDSKRCVFMDEFDGTTKQLQDSLRNLMEEYSDNVFFILSANDINKISEPIRSRCQVINFERPNKADIGERLLQICNNEGIDCNIEQLIDNYYPDIRSMINKLQESKLTGKSWSATEDDFEIFLDHIRAKNIRRITDIVYSGQFDIMGFNNWFFKKLFHERSKFSNAEQISLLLADNEKYIGLGCCSEVIFITNILQVMKYL